MYLETFHALKVVYFQCFNEIMKHGTVIKGLIAMTYKILCKKLTHTHLSRNVENKIYALFHLESFCQKSLLPGKFLPFPPLDDMMT